MLRMVCAADNGATFDYTYYMEQPVASHRRRAHTPFRVTPPARRVI
jgi:hypothetical protein